MMNIVAVTVSFLKCWECSKVVSTPYIPIPTDTPDGGLIIRAVILCPECLEKLQDGLHERVAKTM